MPSNPPLAPKSPNVRSSMDEKKESAIVTDDDTTSTGPSSCSNNEKPEPQRPAETSSQPTEKSTEGNDVPEATAPPRPTVDTAKRRKSSAARRQSSFSSTSPTATKNQISISSNANTVSEWSHQQLAPSTGKEKAVVKHEEEEEWQEMPAYAPYDIYDDDGKLLARENEDEERVSGSAPPGYAELGGAAKGYTRVQVDEDAQSATSMDDNTAYLFKEPGTNVDEDEDARDAISQMQATKNILTENQRIAYVGVVRLATSGMLKDLSNIERSRGSKKLLDIADEAIKLWSQQMMVRLYGHMELDAAEQMMIEQLAEHGLQAGDLTPSLMQTSTIKNPVFGSESKETLPKDDSISKQQPEEPTNTAPEASTTNQIEEPPPPAYEETTSEDQSSVPTKVQLPSQLPKTANIEIDLRWTILCDLFLILISNATYDARSRVLLEKVGSSLAVSSLDICRFEKRVTEALEMEEEALKEDWNEADHMEDRRKRARRRRLAMMGLATVGGGLVIGLSAGLLAPVIGAGLAAGFTTIGVTGTSGFLAGAGGAAVIGTGGVLTGGTIGVRAAERRTGAVKTFEYRPLHNNKRVNLIVTVAGWMNGKVDDVRLPFSTVDPIMGDMYSVLWEPEMLRSMGDTINILATEALTQGLQQILGSTILIALMAALQLPIVLSKLSYLIDNPWSNSLARADMAGLILADSLVDRNLGARPITLVGFSLGSRVIYGCLRELAVKGALGIVQNVYMFGTPVVIKKDEYLRARTIVSGKFVNGFAKNDWILAYLFRATSGGIGRVAGLAEVNVPGIENIEVTEHVPGHMAYRQSMPKLLRQAGFAVLSDEFSEIEDPDPENHEKRQRELINEIEEARKELEEKGEKRRFGFFSKSKKMTKKQKWETYDDRLTGGVEASQEGANGDAGSASGALFDVDAIRKEAVELVTEGIQIKELKSTMPPMKLDSGKLTPQPIGANGTNLPLRETQSYDGLPGPENGYHQSASTKSLGQPNRGGNDFDTKDQEEEISMSFEPSSERRASMQSRSDASPPRSPSPRLHYPVPAENGHITTSERKAPTFEASSQSWRPPSPFKAFTYESRRSPSPQHSPTLEHGARRSRTPSPAKQVGSLIRSSHETNGYEASASKQSGDYWGDNGAPPPPDMSIDRNVWADEDDEDFGKEKEMSMTFE